MTPEAGRHHRTRAEPASPARQRSGDLVDRHGWRLFAVPVLAVLTIVALFRPGSAHHAPQAAAATPAARAGASSATGSVSASPGPVGSGSARSPVITVWSESEPTNCARNTRPSFVLVDIARQHVWMCQGARQVYSSAATTGATTAGNATPTGTWVVQGRQTDRYLSGADYDVFVRYWVPFNGDIGFHDASWQKMPFGAAGYPTLGSHGCVHLPTTVMAWLYHWVKPGQTTVTVVA